MGRRARTAIVSTAALLAASFALIVTGAAPAGATAVSTEAELRTAFANDAEVVLLNDITLTSACTAGDESVRREIDDPVVLDGNGFSITQSCDDDYVVTNAGTGRFIVQNLTVHGAAGGVVADGIVVGEGLVVVGRAIADTIVFGVVGTDITLTDSEIRGFDSATAYGAIVPEGDITLVRTHIHDLHGVRGAAGAYSGGGSLRVDGSRIEGIDATNDTDDQANVFALAADGPLTLTDSVVADVDADDLGIGALGGDRVTVQRSTIVGVRAAAGFGILSDLQRVENSTITGVTGPGVYGTDATLVYSDLVGNGSDEFVVNTSVEGAGVPLPAGVSGVSAPTLPSVGPAAPEVAPQVWVEHVVIFGTVIADAADGVADCAIEGSLISAGYNLADDTSCGLTGTGDRQGAGLDPLLGPLADNGGPTPTFLPQAASPLLDAIPAEACQSGPAVGITTDQRGEPRPGFTACDIGSVELQPVPVIEPAFTG